MCGFPLTRSDRHRRRRQRYRHCYVVPRSTSTSSPFYSIPRSNGSRGVPSGILLTTHNIPTLPLCAARLCIYVFIYISVHTYSYEHIYLYTHLHLYVYKVVVPRVSATSPPRFPLLRYWHIASLFPPPFSLVTTHPYLPYHRSGLEVNSKYVCVCVRARARTNVYNRVLPGTCFSPRFIRIYKHE